jgi:hypothetical protein
MRLQLVIGALVVAVGVPAVAAAAPDSNVCALLTRDEAAAAVGGSVAEGKFIAGGSMSQQGIDVTNCTYTGSGMKELRVNLWSFAPSASQSLEVYRGLCKKKEQAAGVGDLACWYNAKHNELQVLKGSKLLILELSGGRGSDALLTAAKQALGRLK